MYGKCEMLDATKQVFDVMSEKNMVTWNAMLGVYAQNGYFNHVMELFLDMTRLTIEPDEFTLISILSSCACFESLEICRQEEEETDAFKMFNRMRLHGIVPDEVISGLQIHCAIVKMGLLCGSEFLALQDRKEIHSLIFHTGFDLDELTSSALIDMYAKCVDVKSAVQVFEEMGTKKDVISWNSMIVGFAKKGHAESALKVFNEMAHSCVTPDDVIFLGVLTACSHVGWVFEGRQIFYLMVNCYGIKPMADHYACIMDIPGRWGNLKEGGEFIDNLNVEPNAMIWANLLGACRIHGDDIRGERAAKNLIKLEPDNSFPYVLLSNMYAASIHWNEARSLRRTMIQKEIQKIPGCSWIVVGQKTNSFVTNDISHPNYAKI
ncbi:Pentatricopeptide repeat-containing protein [Arachis hypogaea]|uniref:Pentatricopeptide repeat-containing protein n=2 Tax=Arachis hypogaea TaxID=3818 RepID=A0A6B9V8D1_ARAHY|nr:Pentatricopeptide repeat-containing protein [Arachis hypogaea]